MAQILKAESSGPNLDSHIFQAHHSISFCILRKIQAESLVGAQAQRPLQEMNTIY
uniref:Uncharacterized protein n=1 Tax=Arundo donax TaxID=35708 RepID=A0A0A9BFQ2_ARUDO